MVVVLYVLSFTSIIYGKLTLMQGWQGTFSKLLGNGFYYGGLILLVMAIFLTIKKSVRR
ncbi:hypothetical protein HNQ94_000829 [Salirhabdus euzebyi]|uniref:Uncharacterized protein n=1 Tax=Salirhabdus euzebyi TaxID=394506 RepID=A0A841PWT5_9BACI|nr:hypothetical protein [Salirhabdus euzebyi]MBB6452384.1 hypothetical protein [Salirhabdus euzebyi]